jgi:hypothetical protein
MIKKTFLFLCFAVNLLFGQAIHNHWYFGNQAAMNFTTGNPTVLTNSAMTCIDMSASISTKSGKLLFYTNGNMVWDSTHQVMPNGTGLLGGYSGGQIATIAPHPKNSYGGRGLNQYFVFTNCQFGCANGFEYNIVDMNLNSGKGDVTLKNQLLYASSSEKCTIVPHQNGSDYWIISHELTTNAFRVYALTSAGLNTTPIVSNAGTVYGNSPDGYQAVGQLVASKQGNKLAAALYSQNFLEVYDFNNATGTVSNAQTINGYNNSFGCEFSEDGTKLYFTQWQMNKNIYQVDLQNNFAVSMIGTATSGHPTYGVGYLQLAPDGKIYFPKFDSPTLGCISNPNSLGTACGFVDNAINLLGATCSAGLPNNFKYPSNTNAIEQPFATPFEIQWQNPTQGNLSFFTKAAIEPNMEVKLYDISGNLLEKFSLQDFIGKNKGSLNIPNFAAGVYFCVLQKNEKIINNQKVIIY